MSAGSSVTRGDLRSPIVTIYVSLAVYVLWKHTRHSDDSSNPWRDTIRNYQTEISWCDAGCRTATHSNIVSPCLEVVYRFDEWSGEGRKPEKE
jgi:hypothetical protein